MKKYTKPAIAIEPAEMEIYSDVIVTSEPTTVDGEVPEDIIG